MSAKNENFTPLISIQLAIAPALICLNLALIVGLRVLT